MKNSVFTVVLMDEKPETRKSGEFGHIVTGVYSTFETAKSIAEEFKHALYDHVIILESSLGECKIAKEVWRWNAFRGLEIERNK